MDDSLDDFFAKKDKKKKVKPSKGKIVVSDLLPASTPTPPNEPAGADNIDGEQIGDTKLDSGKEKKKQKKKKDKDGDGSSRKEEDEWNEVADETDLSGLRISQKNTMKEKAEEAEANARNVPEYDDEGQIIERPGDGPVWKMADEQSESRRPEPVPEAKPVLVTPNVNADGRYVPPSQRAGGAATLEAIPLRRPMRKKKAPNMASTEDFPSLGAAPPPADYDISRFETVRHGGSSQQSTAAGGPTKVETFNMYSALERR